MKAFELLKLFEVENSRSERRGSNSSSNTSAAGDQTGHSRASRKTRPLRQKLSPYALTDSNEADCGKLQNLFFIQPPVKKLPNTAGAPVPDTKRLTIYMTKNQKKIMGDFQRAGEELPFSWPQKCTV